MLIDDLLVAQYAATAARHHLPGNGAALTVRETKILELVSP
jgi:hypothetical protein